MTAPTMEQLSFHESAHAVCAVVLGLNLKRLNLCPPYTEVAVFKRQLIPYYTVIAAGDAAVARLGVDVAAKSDADELYEAGATADEIVTAKRQAADLVARHWNWIQRTAAALLKRGSLEAADVHRLKNTTDTPTTKEKTMSETTFDLRGWMLRNGINLDEGPTIELAHRLHRMKKGCDATSDVVAINWLRRMAELSDERERGESAGIDWTALRQAQNAAIDREEATWSRGW